MTATVSFMTRRRDRRRNGRDMGRRTVVVRSDDGELVDDVSAVRFVTVRLHQRDARRGIDAAKDGADRARNGRGTSHRSGGVTRWRMTCA